MMWQHKQVFLLIILMLQIICLDGKEVISPEIEDALNHLPDWLNKYVQWHADQRRRHLYSPETKYLTVACFRNGFCGGLSDRLRPLPYFLFFAYKTNRVLFIKWQKFQLEDFLLPVVGGLDWRLPDDIDIGEGPDATGLDVGLIFSDPKHELNKKRNLVVLARDMYSAVKKEYFLTEAPQHGTSADLWKVLFDPVPEIKALIKQTMADLKLTPKKYVSVHIRSSDITFLTTHTAAEELETRFNKIKGEYNSDIENGIFCAAHSVPMYQGYPIYFTASNTNDVKYALRHSKFAENNPGVLVGLENTIRFHSDKIARNHKFNDGADPKHLYPAFVDLYLLANSACVSFGKLGFGRLGGYIGGEQCMIDSRKGKCRMQ